MSVHSVITSFDRLSGAEPKSALERKLGLPEAVGLSLSIVGPSMAMAFNVPLAVRAAGRAAPLAFAIGTIALGIVALSFVSFSRRFAHAGSAYAYIGHAFGWRWGFVAGWTLLLTYLTYAAGCAALIGNFLQAAAPNLGVQHRSLWFAASLGGLLLASFCAYRNVILAGRLMLVLEAISVLAIIFLCVAVLTRVARTAGLPAAPFVPAPDKHWSGIGTPWSSAFFRSPVSRGRRRWVKRREIPSATSPLQFLGHARWRERSTCL